jgi:hypothetical protein
MREYESGLENAARRSKQEGIQIGAYDKAAAIARRMKGRNVPLEHR